MMSAHAPNIPDGQLIVLRSTVSPRTTELLRVVLEEGSGKKEGEDFHLVFAPERVLQTRAVEEIQALPQIVGSFNEAGFLAAQKFFGRFVEKRCIRLTPVEAELGKLITNMYRYVSFAVANEFYMICDSYGANSHAVIAACNEDYARLDLPRPGPNVGGPVPVQGRLLPDRTDPVSRRSSRARSASMRACLVTCSTRLPRSRDCGASASSGSRSRPTATTPATA